MKLVQVMLLSEPLANL